jgi:hypothetical protein
MKRVAGNKYADIKIRCDAGGVIREMIVDSGTEFDSTCFKNVCLSLGIELRYRPSHSGSSKGTIERLMGALNRAGKSGNLK